MFDPISNHAQQAIARLLNQYRSSTKLQNLLSALIAPLQDIEAALGDMNVSRYLPAAVGAQLDLIGKIVGLERPPGASDAVYIQELYGQIKINTSQGQPEQAIQTYQLFTGAALALLFEFFPGEIQMQSDYTPPDQATVEMLIRILYEVIPAGVRPHGLVAYNPMRKFAYAGSLPSAGYGTLSDSTKGGVYPHFYRQKQTFRYAGVNPDSGGYGSLIDPLVGGVYTG